MTWTRPDRIAVTDPVGPRSRHRRDAGTATAELVVALPAIVLALLSGVGAVSAMTTRMRCADTAASAARLAARGESNQSVLSSAHQVAPAGATIRIERTGDTVRVVVATTVRVLPVGLPLPGFAVSGSFEQDLEPGPPP